MTVPLHRARKRGGIIVLAAALASVAALAAVNSGVFTGTSRAQPSASTASTDAAITAPAGRKGDTALRADSDRIKTYVVVFRDAPLATYQGGVAGIAKPARKGNGRGRIDANAPASRKYVGFLADRQRGYEKRIGAALGRELQVSKRMQHAVNAIVTAMSPLEAEAIGRLPEVRLVEAYREVPMDTDIGPHLIGASNIWTGAAGSLGDGPAAARGEGVVVGIIDSGINFGSPSFAAIDPVDGYVHVNPNGAGNYLGTCAPGGIDEGRCNDKLIGGWDFICGAGAPANACGIASLREEPGFGDTNGHGSHTASTVAGNNRTTTFDGSSVAISGVAPRANVIAYDVCYTNLITGQGLCPNVSSMAAANQAVADGVDVINFSIGGGAAPWNDIVSLAFLGATDAGVFVAASAGNSGPGAATLGHVEPWTTTSAASRHRLGGFTSALSVTGPGTPPASLQRILLSPGSDGVALQAPLPGTTPLVVSPGIDTTSDGCTASGGYPAGTFQGAIAVVRRGSCAFSEKVTNAAAAGAVVVVISNNAAGGISPLVPGTTIPAFGTTQAVGNALRDFTRANAGATAGISLAPNAVDALADFSSRGPGGFDVLKPDLAAPGVNVLAAYAGTTITGFENATAAISGTSMASPHTAGAAALMRQMHPSWTVPEIKSALTMTATRSVLLEDQITPADAHAGGAGRLQVDAAVRAGLVLNETTARFIAADPAVGGEASALNLAAIQKANCSGTCTFVRTVRNTTGAKTQWRLRLQGFSGTVEPAALTLQPGQSRQVLITIDNTGAPANGSFRFGSLEITPSGSANGNRTLPALHMPIALRVPPPPPASTIPLANGVPVAIAGATGSQTYYSLVVPAGASSVSFTTAGGTGDLDLYVKWGEAPTSSIDCGSETATNNETCTLVAKPGTYYVRIAGFAAYAGATLTGSYQ
jgi:subtilisin family serine protease